MDTINHFGLQVYFENLKFSLHKTWFISSVQAILNCNEALRLRPRSVRALLCRGALKYCIGAYYHAINDLSQAIELDNCCALAYYNRAVCLHRTKKYQEALKVGLFACFATKLFSFFFETKNAVRF